MTPTVVRHYSVDEAVKLITDSAIQEVRRKSGAPLLIGISGIDCSGKTTLAKALASNIHISQSRTEAVAVDDFIIPRPNRKHGSPPHIDYFENTFDHAALESHLKQLIRLSPGLVIVEGVFLFKQELRRLWDLAVWLEMTTEESVRRGAERDAEYFGSVENARIEYERRFMPAYRFHIERDAPADFADFVFDVA